MSTEKNDTDFATEIRSQQRIIGRLISGQRFKGKVLTCGVDYFQIVELQIEDEDGEFKTEENLDIVKMRYSSVLFFGASR